MNWIKKPILLNSKDKCLSCVGRFTDDEQHSLGGTSLEQKLENEMSSTDPQNPYEAPKEYPPPASGVPTLGPGAELATRGSRFAASVIDSLLMLVPVMPATIVLYFFLGAEEWPAFEEEVYVNLLLFSVFCVSFCVINGYLLHKRGQTVGKYCVGIQIVDYHSGQLLGFTQVLAKRCLPTWVMQWCPFVGNLLSIADVVCIFSEEQRCLHDFIAQTKVVVFDPSLKRTS